MDSEGEIGSKKIKNTVFSVGVGIATFFWSHIVYIKKKNHYKSYASLPDKLETQIVENAHVCRKKFCFTKTQTSAVAMAKNLRITVWTAQSADLAQEELFLVSNLKIALGWQRFAQMRRWVLFGWVEEMGEM